MRLPSTLEQLISLMLFVFFHALYHPLAWTYDWVAAIVSVGRWKSWIFSLLPDISGPQVLELGHGPGHLQIALACKGLTTFGIDLSRQMGIIAQRRMHRSKLASRLVNGMGQHLPFPAEVFDQVVSTFPTPYLFQKQTLDEIFRVLAPEGELLVVPEAWITGSSHLDRIAAAAFRLLGQTYQWDDRYLAPFLDSGFATNIERRKLASSEVLLIKAIKPCENR